MASCPPPCEASALVRMLCHRNPEVGGKEKGGCSYREDLGLRGCWVGIVGVFPKKTPHLRGTQNEDVESHEEARQVQRVR